jgi:hypothetical protein
MARGELPDCYRGIPPELLRRYHLIIGRGLSISTETDWLSQHCGISGGLADVIQTGDPTLPELSGEKV